MREKNKTQQASLLQNLIDIEWDFKREKEKSVC